MRQTTAIFFCLIQVAGLASVLGLSVEKFKGSSPEMDDLCKDLEKLLSGRTLLGSHESVNIC